MIPTSNVTGRPDRRFLRYVLELALDEARNAHKDYLGVPQLFIALTQLEGGCTQDVLCRMDFSPERVRATFRLALGIGKATADTPILPTRRCKEILLKAEQNAIDADSASVDERAITQAVLSERAGVVYELLHKLGIDPARLIEEVLSSEAHTPLELAPTEDASSDAIAGAVFPDIPTHERRSLMAHQQQLTAVLAEVMLPTGVTIRAWTPADFPAIQRISSSEGWPSPVERSAESLLAWQNSWPALVAVTDEEVAGFVRGLTDSAITIYIAEIAVDARLRGHGIGRVLLDACHALYPTTRLDLLTVDTARAFYEACGFRVAYDGMRRSYYAKPANLSEGDVDQSLPD